MLMTGQLDRAMRQFLGRFCIFRGVAWFSSHILNFLIYLLFAWQQVIVLFQLIDLNNKKGVQLYKKSIINRLNILMIDKIYNPKMYSSKINS